MRTRYFLFVVVLCVPFSALGEEFRINVRTAGSQANPALVLTAAGDVIAVWSSYYTSSGRSNEIIARRLTLGGDFLDSEELLVNVTPEGNQTEPDVAANGRGGFVVVWQGPGLDEEDIFLRRFDPNGHALTDERLVNSYTPGRQLCPRIAANDAGTFVVVWESRGQADDGGRSLVCARCFDPNAAARGEPFVVDEDSHDCRYPDVAMDAAGGFAATWVQDRTNKTVFGRRFEPNGAAIAEPFEISQIDCSSITRPSIAMSAAGGFVVTWDGDPNRAGDDDIHARRYDPNGTPEAEPFLVNSSREGAQQWPRAAMNDAGDFVIVWTHETNDPNLNTDIRARRFGRDGAPAANSLQLNTYVWGKQQYPTVAMTDDGAFVTAWEDEEPDGTGYDICACIAPPMIAADFDGDLRVTSTDFATFALHWRQQNQAAPTDLTGDGIVDSCDLAVLCRQWLQARIEDD